MKFFENIFSYLSYALNEIFGKKITNLSISRNICLNRFLCKHKVEVFGKSVLFPQVTACFPDDEDQSVSSLLDQWQCPIFVMSSWMCCLYKLDLATPLYIEQYPLQLGY